MTDVRDNTAAHRYELDTGAGPAIAAYTAQGNTLVFTHTAVPEAAQGEGIATRLIAGALADVRRRGKRIVPRCPFVVAYVERHPDVRDLVVG